MRLLRSVIVVGLCLAPAAASSQTRWDVAGVAGLFAAHTGSDEGEGYREDWFQTAQGGALVGRYLTRHLKAELEVTATTVGARYVARPVDIPGLPYPYWVSSEAATSVRSLGGVLAWQFRDNEWVHPFVLAGLSADLDREEIYTPEQFLAGDPRSGVQRTLIGGPGYISRSDVHLRAAIGGGAKLYFRERAFVRADARVGWGADRQTLAFRTGVGIDF